MQEVHHYKNALITISDYLKETSTPIRQVTLLEYQQRIGSQIDCLWEQSKRSQDRMIAHIQIGTKHDILNSPHL